MNYIGNIYQYGIILSVSMSALQRKLSNTGKHDTGSFVLTLPKEWCELHKLTSGSTLELLLDEITPKSILIQLPGEEVGLKKELIINDRDHHTNAARRRSILGGYLEGYDIIRLNSVSRDSQRRLKIRRDIQELTQKLDGCSTSEEEKSFELTIAPGLRSPIELLEHLFSTTKLMFHDVFDAYLNYDEYLAQDLIQRDDQADKIYFAMVRTLKIILRQPFKVSEKTFALVDTLDFRMIASNLENLCDAAEYVAKALLQLNEDNNITNPPRNRFDKDSIGRINDVRDIILNALEDAYSYYKENNEDAAVVMAARNNETKEYLSELNQIGVHQTMINVVDEAIESLVDLLELVHALPE